MPQTQQQIQARIDRVQQRIANTQAGNLPQERKDRHVARLNERLAKLQEKLANL